MSSSTPRRRRTRSGIAAASLVVSAALAIVLGFSSLTNSSSSSASRPSNTRSQSDPAIANLDPELRRALRRAETAAERHGVEVVVNSGWRSRRDQERLFREAVSTYGSKAEAARWVAVPGTSVHESGQAVDLGPVDATAWLSRHGATYGLCQIYRNEPWHYELRPDAVEHGCPPRYADPTQDPRLRSTRTGR